MKVAIVIESIEPRRGGAETSTAQFVQHLAGRGCDVHVITTSDVPDSPSMTVHRVPVQRPTRRAKANYFMRRADEEARRDDYDVVHSMLPIMSCDVYQPRGGTVAESIERNVALIRRPSLRYAKRLGNRFNLKQRSQLQQERWLLSRFAQMLVAAVSEYVVSQLRRHYRLDESRIRMVFNGVDVPDVTDEQRSQNREEVRREFGLDEDVFVLLAVAHNFRLKGVGTAIEAIARLQKDVGKTKLLIVGRDSPGPFVHQAERLGVADRVVFVGPSERIESFYHAADVLVHPTYYDPCSRVVLEALAGGLPAITTTHNGAAEVIQDGVHGYVIECRDGARELADRIRRLADDGHRRECGKQGKLLRDRLSMRRHVDEMLTVYEEIVNRKARK
jgi:UDP-glucose:(heptosyl)LPS alpha-1,3-glucosyltransferase